MKKHLTLVALFLTISSNAFADSRFSLVGGINYGLDKASGYISGRSYTQKAGLGYAAGFLASIDMIELGALFVSRKYYTTISGSPEVSTSFNGAEFPLMLRFGEVVSFGVGGFATVGDISNYGVTAGPRIGGFEGGLFFDARFNYGLKSGNTKDILALLGFAFGGK